MEETITVVLRVVSKPDTKIIFNSYKTGDQFFGCQIQSISPGDKVQELEDLQMEASGEPYEVEVEDDMLVTDESDNMTELETTEPPYK